MRAKKIRQEAKNDVKWIANLNQWLLYGDERRRALDVNSQLREERLPVHRQTIEHGCNMETCELQCSTATGIGVTVAQKSGIKEGFMGSMEKPCR